MKLTNKQIFENAEILFKAFDKENKYFPAKINFLISRNKKILLEKHDEISKIRNDTLRKYGVMTENNQNTYSFAEENIEIVNQELNDLLNIEQDLDIYTISIEDIEDLEFTPTQMDALLFMIEEVEDIDD